MTEAARNQELLNTLKTFNNTVVSIRLYPANAPQITNAVERGYKAIKHHLRQYGLFTLALRDSEPELCGTILDSEVIQSISNLIVFRQLTLLDVDRFVIEPGLDRGNFKKILEIFSAKVEQIRQEGGGWSFVARLGLDRFFPEAMPELSEAPNAALRDATAEPEITAIESGGTQLLRKEFIDVLHGRERKTEIIQDLQKQLIAPGEGASVLAAAISGVLGSMVPKKIFIASSSLSLVLENCGKLVPADRRKILIDETVALLLKQLQLPAMQMLMTQDLQKEMGAAFSAVLLQKIPIDMLGDVIRELRQKTAQLRLTQTSDSSHLQFLTAAVDRLLATPKGKQYLGQEKAKSIIATGEKARRARRVQAGVQSLLKGNELVLQSEEFTVHLPFVIQKMVDENMDREVKALLKVLISHFQESDAVIRERLIGSLAQIGENLMAGKRWEVLQLLTSPLLYWLKQSDNGDFVYEKTCVALQAVMGQLWKSEKLELGDSILSLFYQIRSGAIPKPEAIKMIISRVQDRGMDRTLLPYLLNKVLANPKDEVMSRRLILQGPIASRFLVESLIRAENSQDRIKIIDLLTYGEQFLPPILVEKLAEPNPWYGKRNLLKLLSETGSKEHLEHVYPFLQHEDLRVQREAFICIYKISGKNRKQALLRALAEASETMKLQIVRALIPFGDAEITRGLSQLLDEHIYYSVEFRDTLLSNVCLAIARCPYPESEKALLKFLELRGKRSARKIGVKVWETAEQALKQIEDSHLGDKQLKAKASQLRKSAMSQRGAVKKAAPERQLITGLTEEKKIRELLEHDDKEKAKADLLELVTKVARLRRFSQADKLRDWLIEIDSLALTEIIRAAEIIEEEKHAAVDKNHLEIWSGLFDVLSTEEFSTFYHGLQHKRYANEETIMKKGATQTALFFINSGRVKLFYRDKDREILVKTLRSGQVLGAGTFFDASVWTVSAAALGQTDLSILKLDNLELWREDYPALESKLQDFCRGFESVDDFFLHSTKDRRQYDRHKIQEMRIVLNLLDKNGKNTGINAKGDLFDFSRGGVSFFMRISKKENARLLLGRGVKITLPIEQTPGKPYVFAGDIMAVRAHHAMEYEYSVHVEFGSVLSSTDLQQILQQI
jgi:CRP-like cAMP-binding protein